MAGTRLPQAGGAPSARLRRQRPRPRVRPAGPPRDRRPRSRPRRGQRLLRAAASLCRNKVANPSYGRPPGAPRRSGSSQRGRTSPRLHCRARPPRRLARSTPLSPVSGAHQRPRLPPRERWIWLRLSPQVLALRLHASLEPRVLRRSEPNCGPRARPGPRISPGPVPRHRPRSSPAPRARPGARASAGTRPRPLTPPGAPWTGDRGSPSPRPTSRI